MPEPQKPDESDESTLGKYGWSNPAPFWRRVITFLCMFGAFVFCSYTNASNFDESEYKFLAMVAPILIGREILAAWKDAKR